MRDYEIDNQYRKAAESSSIQIKDPGEFEWIDKGNIWIEYEYQRSQYTATKRRLIIKIIKNFNWANFGVLSVAVDNRGMYACIDGGGRLTATRAIRSITRVPCMVFRNMPVREQAGVFVDSCMDRINIGWHDRYKAALVSGDPIMLRVKKFVDLLGRNVDSCSSSNNISCVSYIYKYCQNDSIYNLMLEMAPYFKSFFHGEPFNYRVFIAIVLVLLSVADHDKNEVLNRLHKFSPILVLKHLEGHAAEIGRPMNDQVKKIGLLKLLNKGRRSYMLKESVLK